MVGNDDPVWTFSCIKPRHDPLSISLVLFLHSSKYQGIILMHWNLIKIRNIYPGESSRLPIEQSQKPTENYW